MSDTYPRPLTTAPISHIAHHPCKCRGVAQTFVLDRLENTVTITPLPCVTAPLVIVLLSGDKGWGGTVTGLRGWWEHGDWRDGQAQKAQGP